MVEKRLCLQWDDGTELIHMRKDVIITMDHLNAAVSVWYCPICGEYEFDADHAQRYADRF